MQDELKMKRKRKYMLKIMQTMIPNYRNITCFKTP